MPKGNVLSAAPECGCPPIGRVSGKPSARGDGQACKSAGCLSLGTPQWIAGILPLARYRDQSAAGGDVSPSVANSRRVCFGLPALALALAISSAAGAILAPASHV